MLVRDTSQVVILVLEERDARGPTLHSQSDEDLFFYSFLISKLVFFFTF